MFKHRFKNNFKVATTQFFDIFLGWTFNNAIFSLIFNIFTYLIYNMYKKNITHLFPGWFGIRKDFCQFLLSVFPLLQEYANIAYNNNVNRQTNEQTSEYRDDDNISKDKKQKNQKKNEALKPIVPITSIDVPD